MALTGEQLLIFQVGVHTYGIQIGQVREVVGWRPATPLPGAPPTVQGVMDLRGQVVPIVDMGERFGVPRSQPGQAARIMVVDLGGRQVGLVVDEVSGVGHLSAGGLEPPSPGTVSARDPLTAGIARVGERLVVVIDPSQVTDLEAVTRVLSGAGEADPVETGR